MSLQSIESDSKTIVGRSDLRRCVRIRSTDECLLQRRRLAPKFGHDVAGRGGIGSSPIVARGSIQDVGGTRGALPTVARGALRRGVEESGGGYVGVLVDVVGEALAVVLGCRRQCGGPVASLLQAHVAPCRARHVHFHPRGWEGLAALDGASPAVAEGHKLGFAAVEGDVLELASTIVGVIGPEGEGLCGAAVGEKDTDPAACRRGAGFEEGLERARNPGAGGLGLSWRREDGGDGGREGEAEAED